MVIGGQRRSMPPTARRSRSSSPSTGIGHGHRAARRQGGRRSRRRGRPGARSTIRKGWSSWSASKRGRTLAKFSALVKANLEELARTREPQRRQADHRRPRRGARRQPRLRVLRRRGEQGLRRDDPGQQARPRLHAPRADRRRRPDRPVELPDADGQLEARTGARRRQHLHPQAGQLDPADGDPARRARPRGRLPRRRGQRGDRIRADRRAPRSPGMPGSARSPSPARRRPARRSCGWPRPT